MEFTKNDSLKVVSEGSSLIPLLLKDGWVVKEEKKKPKKGE